MPDDSTPAGSTLDWRTIEQWMASAVHAEIILGRIIDAVDSGSATIPAGLLAMARKAVEWSEDGGVAE